MFTPCQRLNIQWNGSISWSYSVESAEWIASTGFEPAKRIYLISYYKANIYAEVYKSNHNGFRCWDGQSHKYTHHHAKLSASFEWHSDFVDRVLDNFIVEFRYVWIIDCRDYEQLHACKYVRRPASDALFILSPYSIHFRPQFFIAIEFPVDLPVLGDLHEF